MTQERRLSEIQNIGKPKNSSTLLGVFASRKREWPRRQECRLTACRFLNVVSVVESAGSVSVIEHRPSVSPVFKQASMTLTIQFPIRQKILTIALLTIVCMLIACFPTAALILIKKYIWVRIWIAKCELRPLDFAQKYPRNAGNAISENQISKIFPGGMPLDPPGNASSLWPNVLAAQNLS